MAAPRVVAKGADHVAQRIKDVAREHGVPDRSRTSRSRARSTPRRDRRSRFPADLFEAVAEVLAYLVRLKQLAI